ncbi:MULTISPECIES: MerR family transcriptional regulator [unclassified Streptomyces]|uniref:MerR family transcriptional regulator n=1 Tax=unclassified Streptomyces TaxID=2593676 RepID=UPI00036CEAE0|nr:MULTISPECIES: MerR family transcriptional regulator [unclassified Streptomyces]MYX30422.1 MerR family transcriptional regulator [Streptomyces sp. SID8381]
MRISELSRKSGVSVTTIKFYIREELLPPGRHTSPTQAEYDEHHLRRLRLIRALIGVRGLSVEATRQVLGALSEEQSHPHLVLGLALGAIRLSEEPPEESEQPAAVEALVKELGWQVHQDAPARGLLAETLASLQQFGVALDWRVLLPYARLAEETARLDLDQLEGVTDPLELAERAVVLTTLLEPALMALRRLAQEHESAQRHKG